MQRAGIMGGNVDSALSRVGAYIRCDIGWQAHPDRINHSKEVLTLEWLRHCTACRHDRLLATVRAIIGSGCRYCPCAQRTGDGEVERKLCRKP
jgi:hypothetical protein